MRDASNPVRAELRGIFIFIGIIWAVYFASAAFPVLDTFGVVPRTLSGIWGVAAMPFLHANLHHLLSNTVPLLVLLTLLAGSRARSWEVVVDVVIFGGLLLWLFGRPAIHIGASGLIFGLIAFLIVSGLLEKRPLPLLVAIVVGFLYGGSLLTGVLPQIGTSISWDGHLCGAVAGGGVAYGLVRGSRSEATTISAP